MNRILFVAVFFIDAKNLVVHPAQNARVVVSFDSYGRKEQVTYSLTSTGKIADIRYSDGRSLLELLRSTGDAP